MLSSRRCCSMRFAISRRLDRAVLLRLGDDCVLQVIAGLFGLRVVRRRRRAALDERAVADDEWRRAGRRARSSASSSRVSRLAAPLGFEDQVADFAHRAGAAGCLRDEVRVRLHARMRIRDRDRQPRDLEDRQVGECRRPCSRPLAGRAPGCPAARAGPRACPAHPGGSRSRRARSCAARPRATAGRRSRRPAVRRAAPARCPRRRERENISTPRRAAEKYSRPSVSTPSTSSTSRRTSLARSTRVSMDHITPARNRS